MLGRLCGTAALFALAGCGAEPVAVEQPDFSKDPEMQRLIAEEAAARAPRSTEGPKPERVAPATNADDDPFFKMPASDYQPKTY